MSTLTFRIANIDDIAPVAALVNRAYRGDSSRQGWTTEADLLDGQRTDAEAIREIISASGNVMLLCRQGSNVVGTVHLRHEDRSCYFGMFTVRPDLQGQGIGKQFIAHAEQYARNKWACTSMRMTVIDLREELLQWYVRRGYHETGKYADFPYGDERFGLPRRDDLRLTILEKSLVE